jgi:hypothetical protein
MKSLSLAFILIFIGSAAAHASCASWVYADCGTNATCFDQNGPTAAVNGGAQASATKAVACAGASVQVVATRNNSNSGTTTFTWYYTANSAGGVTFNSLEIDHEQKPSKCFKMPGECATGNIVVDDVYFTVSWPVLPPGP